jgi:hypothetical protein
MQSNQVCLCNPSGPSPLPGKRLLGGDTAKFWAYTFSVEPKRDHLEVGGRLQFLLYVNIIH